MSVNKFALSAVLACLLLGCNQDEDHDHGDGEHGHQHEDDGHQHEDGHEDEHEHHHHDSKSGNILGVKEIGDYTVEARQLEGLEEEKQTVFEFSVQGNEKPILRAWFGDQEGAVLDMKSKSHLHGADDYGVHLKVLKDMPKTTKLWVEIEDNNARTQDFFDLDWDMKE